MIDLRAERTRRGLTQQQLADAAGNVVTRVQIHNIEQGKTKVSVNTAKALAAVLNIDWGKFFDD